MAELSKASDIIRSGVAVVTGAGSGLGRALSVELTRRNVRVVGFGRRESALDETQQLCGRELFTAMVVDVADARAVEAAFDEIRQEIGDVTILINNAAVYPHVDFLHDTPEHFMQTVQINLGGMVACAHAALKAMAETGVGRIIEVGSYADLSPLPCSGAYSVSKGASRIFTRALIADLSDRFPDIVISTWMPGVLATDMGVPDGLDPAQAAKWGASLALWHERSLNGTIFEGDKEILPGRSLKGRIKNLLLLKKSAQPRHISAHL